MVARRRWTVVVSALAVTVGSAGSPALGAITYLTSFRAVRANGFVNGDFEGAPSFTSSTFGDFNQMTSHTFSGGRGSARASQFSRLLPERIEVTEFAEVSASGLPGLEGLAQSSFDITFTIAEAQSFVVQQSHASPGMPGPVRNVQARLVGPSGTVFDWIEDGLTSNWPTGSVAGSLSPGQYQLVVDCRIQTGGGVFQPISGVATLMMIVPSPGVGITVVELGLLIGVFRRRRSRD